MEAIMEALETYVSSDDVLLEKLWERLVRELGLTQSKSSLYHCYKGAKIREAVRIFMNKISEASSKHGIEESVIVDEALHRLLLHSELWIQEALYARRLSLELGCFLFVAHDKEDGLCIYTSEAAARGLLDEETQNVASKLLSLLGEELKKAKTERDVQAVLEKHLDLLERLYVEENDAFKKFVDAVKGVENRLARALKKMNLEALAMELKYARW